MGNCGKLMYLKEYTERKHFYFEKVAIKQVELPLENTNSKAVSLSRLTSQEICPEQLILLYCKAKLTKSLKSESTILCPSPYTPRNYERPLLSL